ncbi:hypothetical protein EW146_g1594 [Bondarzewia mesenterica]|uniref:cAMP-independent regulatory protein pac2 n=1 Tax=Bondarzewia mesenterica TaxID=1095465 RepID=A0A4S4M3F2_9AGAM|nr:hypothetical protein EW146_g1594 [Bondarzewia mesenterica]
MSPTYKQQPTLKNVRVRTSQDALQVFYGVARNALTMLSRRLDADERKSIRPGNVYVWEDRSATTSETAGLSMERWTDGLQWGPSRVRDEFLFYFQREHQANERLSTNASGLVTPLILNAQDLQTYSVFVSLPEDRPHDITRKWHLTAYFTQRTSDTLGEIGSIPGIGDVDIPEGFFWSTRSMKGRRDELRRTPNGQLLVYEHNHTPSSSSGALYTIFPSSVSESAPMHEASFGPDHSRPETHQSRPSDQAYSVANASRAPRTYASYHSTVQPTPPLTPPRPISSHSLSPVPPPPPLERGGPSLVPLEYLKACSRTYRNPADESALRQLCIPRTSSSSTIERDRVSSRSPSIGIGGDYYSDLRRSPLRRAMEL